MGDIPPFVDIVLFFNFSWLGIILFMTGLDFGISWLGKYARATDAGKRFMSVLLFAALLFISTAASYMSDFLWLDQDDIGALPMVIIPAVVAFCVLRWLAVKDEQLPVFERFFVLQMLLYLAPSWILLIFAFVI